MREFSKISPAVWDSERFMSLPTDDARFLYMYLLTCEHQTSAGAFKLKDGYATDDLRWTLERYQVARAALIEADLIKFDAKSGVVLITRWFRHNPPMNESHFKGVARVIQKLPSETLKQEALEALEQAFHKLQVGKALSAGKTPPAAHSELGPGLKAYAQRNGLAAVQGGRS
jgi:hypothetical protein